MAEAEREYRYNLVPFVEIRRFWIYREQLGVFALFTNLIGNVLGFIPYGFILPVIHNGLRSGFLIILSGFGLSLCVETIQLVTKVGCFDVDDLILIRLARRWVSGLCSLRLPEEKILWQEDIDMHSQRKKRRRRENSP